MALPATVYRVSIELNDVDRHCYAALSTTAAQHPSETQERLLVRLLAYALCYDDGLTFTRGICVSDEPDIWLKTADDRVAHWIEVGLPDPQRVLKACRHCQQVTLFAYGSAAERWLNSHRAQLAELTNFELYRVDDLFLASLLATLQRNIHWQLTRSDSRLYLAVAQTHLETELIRIDLSEA